MKCIKEKCERYQLLENKGKCTIDKRCLDDYGYCLIETSILEAKCNLNYLKDLKQYIKINQ